MKQKVSLEGIELHAYHGVYETEKRDGAMFRVDVSFCYDASKAVGSDALEDAFDYTLVYNLVKKEMAIRSDLLEHVAGRIVSSLHRQFDRLDDLRVKVCKLNPPVDGSIAAICVEIQA